MHSEVMAASGTGGVKVLVVERLDSRVELSLNHEEHQIELRGGGYPKLRISKHGAGAEGI